MSTTGDVINILVRRWTSKTVAVCPSHVTLDHQSMSDPASGSVRVTTAPSASSMEGVDGRSQWKETTKFDQTVGTFGCRNLWPVLVILC